MPGRSLLLNEMLAEWSAIPTADILWRVDGPVDLEPGRDGKNLFFVDPESVHGVRTGGGRWSEEIDGVRGVVEIDHGLGTPEESVSFPRSAYDTPWAYVANAMGMHPLGHVLGLGHAASLPVARSCPPPTYAVDNCGPVDGDSRYWRRIRERQPGPFPAVVDSEREKEKNDEQVSAECERIDGQGS